MRSEKLLSKVIKITRMRQSCFRANLLKARLALPKIWVESLVLLARLRGLKYFYKDRNDNAVIYPQYLRKSEKRLKKQQRRLSKKLVKGASFQSKNYHKARIRLGKTHLKIQRQRKDWAIKTAKKEEG